jgi:hypothetical protein
LKVSDIIMSRLKCNELASGVIKDFGAIWKYYSLTLTASGSDPKAHLEISGDNGSQIYFRNKEIRNRNRWLVSLC